MTLLEYLKEVVSRLPNKTEMVYEDSQGNLGIRRDDLSGIWDEERFLTEDISTYQAIQYIIRFFEETNETYTPLYKEQEVVDKETGSTTLIFHKEHTIFLNSLEVIEDPEVKEYETAPKYPYYRLRGKPVTPAQALEIIRRTDEEFAYGKLKEAQGADYIGSLNFINSWLRPENDTRSVNGWVHPDGTIGTNNITTKYPNWAEFLYEMLGYIVAFPYLDFVVAITDWDNFPEYVWEHPSDSEYCREKVDSDYPDFLDHVDYGIWVHNNTVEFMEPIRARAKYQEYAALYGAEDTSKYIYEYYKGKGLYDIESYTRKCLEANTAAQEEGQEEGQTGDKQ